MSYAYLLPEKTEERAICLERKEGEVPPPGCSWAEIGSLFIFFKKKPKQTRNYLLSFLSSKAAESGLAFCSLPSAQNSVSGHLPRSCQIPHLCHSFMLQLLVWLFLNTQAWQDYGNGTAAIRGRRDAGDGEGNPNGGLELDLGLSNSVLANTNIFNESVFVQEPYERINRLATHLDENIWLLRLISSIVFRYSLFIFTKQYEVCRERSSHFFASLTSNAGSD